MLTESPILQPECSVMSLGRWLARLVSPLREDDPPPRPASPVSATAKSVRTSLDTEEARSRLRAIVNGQTTFSTGCFHLIGLSAVRQKLASRWAVAELRIQQLVERLLKQHLGPEDVWFRHGSDVYVVVFARMNKLEAQLFCGKIMQELHRLLLGDDDAASVVVETVVLEADGTLKVESHSLPSLLSTALGTFQEADGAAAAGRAALAAADASRQRAPKHLGWNFEDVECEPIAFRYRPVWDARHEVVSTYHCRPMRRHPSGTVLWGYDVLRDASDPEAIVDLDVEILSHSVSMLHELVANKFRLMVTVPVHFETMAVLGRRRQYLQLLRMVPRPLAGLLAIALKDLPVGIPASRLIEFVNVLKPHCRAVLARADLETADMAAFAAAGVRAVGVGLPHAPGEAQRHRYELARFCAAAHKLHMLTYLDEADAGFAATEQGAAFDFLMGDAVGPWTEVPGTAVRRTREELLSPRRRPGRASRPG